MKGFFLFCSVFLMLISCTLPVQAISNDKINWGFSKSKNHEPADAGRRLNELIKKYGAFYHGNTKEKTIYLTFDNGYENGYSDKVLDVLKKHKVKAAFFVTGHFVTDQPELIKRMADEGHIIGNHSYHHPDLTTKTARAISEELETVNQAVFQVTGKTDNLYLRPPRGVFSERVLNEAEKLGYQTVFWSAAFVDWKIDSQKGWKYAYNNIMKQAHPGVIYLLHTVSKDNAEALDQAITDLKREGYTFKSLDDLLFEKQLLLPAL